MYVNEYKTENVRVRTVADSIFNGIRLTTLELRYPRIIHAEFMTHRMFSRNASSSRAIPFGKHNDMWIPNLMQYNKKGMQGGEELSKEDKTLFRFAWSELAKKTQETMSRFTHVHKQWVNRPKEWFGYIDVVVSATEWNNFFQLRRSDAAQPEIHVLADCMNWAMLNSTPTHTKLHSPYSDITEVSVAKCARVSYKNHNNENSTMEEDIALHDRLLKMKHMSPFEHRATAIEGPEQPGITHIDMQGYYWSGNFKSWAQYRHTL